VTYNPYGPGAQAPRRRRGGCLRSLVIGVVVIVILLVAADFVAKAVAQNVAASQIQKQGFPKKPSVKIEGFPFLTQVASRDLHQVRLSASDVPEGPVEITAVNAVANNIHLNSGFNSGTIGQVSGTVLISFGSLSSTVTKELGPAGQLVASCAFPWFPESATWRRRSARLLERELMANTFPSGIGRELASDYQGFVAELTLLADHREPGVAAAAARARPRPQTALHRTARCSRHPVPSRIRPRRRPRS